METYVPFEVQHLARWRARLTRELAHLPRDLRAAVESSQCCAPEMGLPRAVEALCRGSEAARSRAWPAVLAQMHVERLTAEVERLAK